MTIYNLLGLSSGKMNCNRDDDFDERTVSKNDYDVLQNKLRYFTEEIENLQNCLSLKSSLAFGVKEKFVRDIMSPHSIISAVDHEYSLDNAGGAPTAACILALKTHVRHVANRLAHSSISAAFCSWRECAVVKRKQYISYWRMFQRGQAALARRVLGIWRARLSQLERVRLFLHRRSAIASLAAAPKRMPSLATLLSTPPPRSARRTRTRSSSEYMRLPTPHVSSDVSK